MPCHRAFPEDITDSGRAFLVIDRLLDQARTGPSYLREPAVAEMIVEAIEYNAEILEHYVLHAFVVVPNHVHLLATPNVALGTMTRSLKRYYSEESECDVGNVGQALLAKRELRPIGKKPKRV